MPSIPKPLVIAAVVLQLWGCVHSRPKEVQRADGLSRQPTTAVTLRLNVANPVVAVGEDIVFTFEVTQEGEVSLWNIGANGEVQRIYPRRAKATHVQAGQRYRVGGANTPAFKAGGPVGEETVYLVWTLTLEGHPEVWDNRVFEAKSINRDRVARFAHHEVVTTEVTFDIIVKEPTREKQDLFKAKVLSEGDTHILAFGSNVMGLTKTHIDIRRFADDFQTLFRVPKNRIHLYENAYKRDFYEGMERLQKTVQPGDLVFIFYSGHGTHITDDSGDETDGLDEAFVMYDAADAPGISLKHLILDDDFAARIEQLPTERVIVYLDACFSSQLVRDPITPVEEAMPIPNARPKFLSSKNFLDDLGKAALRWGKAWVSDPTFDQPAKGLFYAAAQGKEYAYEVEEGGLFITTFLEQLRQATHGNFMTVFYETAVRVSKKSGNKQRPKELGNKDLGFALRFVPLSSQHQPPNGQNRPGRSSLVRWFQK